MLKPWLQVSGPVLQPIPFPCQPLLLPSTPEAALPAAATSCCRAGLAPWHRGGDYKSYQGLPAAQFPQNSFLVFFCKKCPCNSPVAVEEARSTAVPITGQQQDLLRLVQPPWHHCSSSCCRLVPERREKKGIPGA